MKLNGAVSRRLLEYRTNLQSLSRLWGSVKAADTRCIEMYRFLSHQFLELSSGLAGVGDLGPQ